MCFWELDPQNYYMFPNVSFFNDNFLLKICMHVCKGAYHVILEYNYPFVHQS
jgi:hypothetical protein